MAPSPRHKWDPRCDPPDSLVWPVRIDPTGATGPTPGQARGPRWRKTSHGFYVPTSAPTDLPEQRILEQAARLPEGGAVTGWASLRLQGGTFFDGLGQGGRVRLPIPLNPGPFHQLTESPECTVSRDRLFSGETERWQGIPCSTASRALFDEMRYARTVRAAVVAMDMAAAAELAALSLMTLYVEQHPAWRGVDQVRQALPLCSEHSLSPQETLMRLVWVLDAGLPVPLCNRPVFTKEGRYVGRPDMLDPEAGLVVEFDGADHRLGPQHVWDVEREDRFRRLGFEYCKITGPDMRDHRRVVDRMHAARRRAHFRVPSARSWTLEPPVWWKAEPPLEERIAARVAAADRRRMCETEPLGDVAGLRGW